MPGKLTDAQLRGAKATGKPYKLFDGGGLHAVVTAKGSKLWRVAYRINGKRDDFRAGRYPEISLAEARAICLEVKRKVASGIDPNAEKKERKETEKREAEIKARTFRAVALEWQSREEGKKARSTNKKRMGHFAKLFSFFGDKPIAELERKDVLDAVKPYDEIGKANTAHELVRLANQVCRYALIMRYCEYNAASDIGSMLNGIKTTHHSCFTNPNDLGLFLRSAEAYQGYPQTTIAMRVMLYTILRYTEVINARWSEIDFDQALWAVPATRSERPEDGGGMKCRIPHIVPLAPQVLELFRKLRALNFSNDLIFPGRNTRSRPLSSGAIKNALRSMGYEKEDICAHGFRGTFSTLANEKKIEWGIDGDLIEKTLAHKGKDQIREAYNHAEYLEQRRRLMNIWADFLDELKNAAE